MRWEESLFKLFDDLEMQAQGLYLEDRLGEVEALAESEYAEVGLASRIHACLGTCLRWGLLDGTEVRGRLTRAGSDWVLVDSGSSEWLIRLPAVALIDGLGTGSLSPDLWPIEARLSARSALRGIAEAAGGCVVRSLTGRQAVGRLGRVGADFIELETASGVLILPITAVAAVQGVP